MQQKLWLASGAGLCGCTQALQAAEPVPLRLKAGSVCCMTTLMPKQAVECHCGILAFRRLHHCWWHHACWRCEAF